MNWKRLTDWLYQRCVAVRRWLRRTNMDDRTKSRERESDLIRRSEDAARRINTNIVKPLGERRLSESQRVALDAIADVDLRHQIKRAYFDLLDAPSRINDDDRIQSVIHWIPVSERLPEEHHVVLAYGMTIGGENRIDMAWHVKGDWYGHARVPSHWAELPAPPAGEEGEG